MSHRRLLLVFALLALAVAGLGAAGPGVAVGKTKPKKGHEKTEQEELKKIKEKYAGEREKDKGQELEEESNAKVADCPEGEEKCTRENLRKLRAADRKAKDKYKARIEAAKEKYEIAKEKIEEKYAEPEEKFTIVTEQEVSGSGAGYTKEKLESEVGKTIDYEITVTNTGTTALKLDALEDANCTGISPAGEVTLETGKSQIYTCAHELTSANATENGGIFDNTATIEAGPTERTSNKVEAKVNA